ncbi:hypothetical protein GCM10007859_13340 [Brevundimonas denitrificans]|uniref:DUF4231 domain-containing protein n=1 Tax=Brevundimonas denitrificans TaxID=1443434 RepID=A0ABQ6BJ44_9CAUL|nr:hypothetical protein [Brevundimonas denitrificans]GLS01321.1 hypothetical protein GCM10007859_13340 [Brevundimonas denitrificans]
MTKATGATDHSFEIRSLEHFRSLKRSVLLITSAALVVALGTGELSLGGVVLPGDRSLAFGLLLGAAVYYAWGAVQELRFAQWANSDFALDSQSFQQAFEGVQAELTSIKRDMNNAKPNLVDAAQKLHQFYAATEHLPTQFADLEKSFAEKVKIAERAPNWQSNWREIWSRMSDTIVATISDWKSKSGDADAALGNALQSHPWLESVALRLQRLEDRTLVFSRRISQGRRAHFAWWDIGGPAGLLTLTTVVGLPHLAALVGRIATFADVVGTWWTAIVAALQSGTVG